MVKKNLKILLQDKYEGLDEFGITFRFNMPGGKRTFQTSFGATISILMWIMLISYALLQFHRLHSFGETVITSSEKDSFYDFNTAFPDSIDDIL